MSVSFMPATYSKLLARLIISENRLREGEIKEQLFLGTSLSYGEVEHETSQISVKDQYKIISNALLLSDKEGLGLRLGVTVDLLTHGVMGIAALTSPTLLDVFKTLVRYYKVRIPVCEFDTAISDECLILRIRNIEQIPDHVNLFLIEAYSSMFQTVIDSIVGGDASEFSVTFPFPEPLNNELYEQFFHGEVRFKKQQYLELNIPLELASHPCPSGDALINRQAELGCQELIDQIQRGQSFSDKVAQLLDLENGTLLQLEELANMLNVSRRTLIRKLKNEGTSYKQLMDLRQKELSLHYLANGTLSIEAIAHMLGYSYVANFRRAFNRWFGVSPSEYRSKFLMNMQSNC